MPEMVQLPALLLNGTLLRRKLKVAGQNPMISISLFCEKQTKDGGMVNEKSTTFVLSLVAKYRGKLTSILFL
jgi:hypothetical protein